MLYKCTLPGDTIGRLKLIVCYAADGNIHLLVSLVALDEELASWRDVRSWTRNLSIRNNSVLITVLG